jgi:wobble nucleotide-excising tRNase
MLRKIVSIKNVGRFPNYSAAGNVTLNRYNLIFGENGRGKTTLCAIFRSLQSGDATHIIGRTTLGNTDPPEIRIVLSDGTITVCAGGAWSATFPNLAVFDATFVSENVHSGDAVGVVHRRNLYRVIIGKEGVDLARQIEELDMGTRDKSGEIRMKQNAVEVFMPKGMTIESFLRLPEDPTIDAKITEKDDELAAVKQADQIKRHAGLVELELPSFPAGFAALLGKTIPDVAEEAERRITAQIEKHEMGQRGESWLSEGLGYVRENACPFCGQNVGGIPLIAAYRTYFGEAYDALRTEISALCTRVDTDFSDRKIAEIERVLDQNGAAVEFWSPYGANTSPVLPGADEIGDALRALRQAARSLLDRKAAAPLDRVTPDESFSAAHAAFTTKQNKAAAYNKTVEMANEVIGTKKAATSATDLKTVENALAGLRTTKKRHEEDVKTACAAYQTARAEKKTLEDRKTVVKKELDEYTAKVIPRYERTINRLLDKFQAGFRITKTGHGYGGGVASSSYEILINDMPVELGDAGSPLSTPSFRNTLSSGDKSTLALAFFLAQLEHDPDRGDKVVVFDDPFNSQDSFRRECTVMKIIKSGDLCRQVFVLSHDQIFLKRIWDRLATRAAERKCLRLDRVGERNTTIREWDIEETTQPTFVASRRALANYFNSAEGDPRQIVLKLRPTLETYCKNIRPEDFGNDTLGTIVGKIREVGPAHTLFPVLADLDETNEYTRRYHHGDDPSTADEPINDTELQGFVKRALKVIGCC